MNVSCGDIQCAMALQASHDEFWPNIPILSQIALLIPTYEHYYDCNPKEWVEEHRKDNMVPPHSAEFSEGRETMTTWTRTLGWQADAKVPAKCREADDTKFGKRVVF